MSGLPGSYVVRGPAGFFGAGASVRSFPLYEAFTAYLAALEGLGKKIEFEGVEAVVRASE